MKTLTKIKKHILPFTLCLLMLIAQNSMASESKENFNFITTLINEIRTDPLGKAESLGYDRNMLKLSLPWLEESYPPCERDTFLDLRAAAHNYLNEEITEPEIFPQHDYARTGETGGVLAFFNFLSPDNAAKIIVENIFKQELNPERTAETHILNKNFTRLGIAMDAGLETVDQYSKNAYFITLCFGSYQLRSEVQVLTMINQVRSNPSSLITYLEKGSSIIELLDNNLNLLSEWFKQYPPLMDNFFLHQSAQKFAEYLLNFGDIDYTLDSDPLIRALDMGYLGSGITETIAIQTGSPNEISPAIADAVFSRLVKDELQAAPQRGGIFSSNANEAGMGISFVLDNDQIQVITSALDVGIAPLNDTGKINLYGVVYSDADKNNFYSPGEGQKSAVITITQTPDMVITNKIITDLDGHFTALVNANESYQIEVSTGEILLSMEMVPTKNCFFPIEIPIPPEDTKQ